MVEFRKVTYDDVRPLCNLQVAEHQQGFVSRNAYTLGEMNFEPGALVQGIWEGNTPVGLIAMIDTRLGTEMSGDHPAGDSAFLWRLMIDQNHQGKGYGNAAIAQAIRVSCDWGFEALTLTVANEPGSALPFYQAHGFELTGRILWGDEYEMRRSAASI